MSTSYVSITELEFDTLLKSSKGWIKEVVCKEFVYTYKTKKNPNIVVEVYSSLSLDGVSRSLGKDSIKVCAVNIVTNRGIIKTSRIHRTLGWDERLKTKILDVISKIY